MNQDRRNPTAPGPMTVQVVLAVVLFALFQLAALCFSSGQEPVARIMPLGDSITRGSNDINYPNGDIPGGDRKKLGELLTSSGYSFDFVGERNDNAAPGMDPDHNGYNGYRTDQLLAELPWWLAKRPDSVLLHIGTNDILQGIPLDTAEANLGKIIDLLVISDPHRRVYVATLIPINQAWNGQTANVLNSNVNAFNIRVRNLVQQRAAIGRHVLLVDMNALLVYSASDPAEDFFQPGDGIHPGQAGYNQMGTLWFNAITESGSLTELPVSNTPLAPTLLAAMPVSASRINLTWSDESSNESGFKIYQRIGTSGNWELISTAPPNATAYAVTGLTTGSESYHFAIASTNTATDSPWSNIASSIAENRALGEPATASSIFSATFSAPNANNGNPQDLWSSASNDTAAFWSVDLSTSFRIQQLRLTTRPDVDQPSARRNFEIRASNNPSFATFSVLGAQGSTALPHASTWSLAVENPNSFRYIRVAKTDGTFFNFSEIEVYAAVAGSIPAAPSNIAAASTGSKRIDLVWQVNSTNESGFQLERKTGPGIFEEIATLPAATASYADTGLTPDTAYSYRLSATSELGNSSFSDVLTTRTIPPTGYDVWSEGFPAFSALPAASQDPMADPNKDGTCNLFAYAFGLDPLSDASLSLPVIGREPALVFRYRRNKLAPELAYEVLASSDLSSTGWSMVNQENAVISPIEGESGVERVSVPIPLAPGEAVMFVRLRVAR